MSEEFTNSDYLDEEPNYAMFNSKGNERIEKLFKKLNDKLEGTQEDVPKFEKELDAFMSEYVGLADTKTYGEATDTAVRDIVLPKLIAIAKQIFTKPYINPEVLVRIIWGRYI